MSKDKTLPDTSAAHAARIGAEADRWLARFNAGALSPEDARAFNQWLAASPEHERQFRAGQSAMREVLLMRGEADLGALMQPTLYERAHGALYDGVTALRRGAVIRPVLAIAGAIAACLGAIYILSSAQSGSGPADVPLAETLPKPLYATEVAQIRDITLPDGTTVTLGASSALDIRFTGRERRVVLSDGEAFFDVAKNPERPFVVVAGNTLVRVLGTKFDVNLGDEAVDVAVLEGRVEVIRPERVTTAIRDSDIKHVLTAGQQVASPKAGPVRPVQAVEAGNVAAWRRGELIWVDRPVRDIIADLNRYSETRIILADSELGSLEYTLAVQADELPQGVRLLAATLGRQVHERDNGDLVIE